MQKITIPKSFKIIGANGKPFPYTFGHFMNEFVWQDARWRDDWATSFAKVAEVFPIDVSGTVTLPDVEHEHLRKCVREIKFTPAHNQYLTNLMWMIHAVTLSVSLGKDKEEKKPGAMALKKGKK